MTSRSTIITTSIALGLLLTISGCFNTVTKPTRFIGKVIDSSSNEPISDGHLIFRGERYTGIYIYTVSRDTVYLDPEGNFDWTVTTDDEGIISISILVVAKKTETGEFLNVDLTDCSPYNNCYNFTPGKKHTVDIKVTWPPDE